MNGIPFGDGLPSDGSDAGKMTTDNAHNLYSLSGKASTLSTNNIRCRLFPFSPVSSAAVHRASLSGCRNVPLSDCPSRSGHSLLSRTARLCVVVIRAGWPAMSCAPFGCLIRSGVSQTSFVCQTSPDLSTAGDDACVSGVAPLSAEPSRSSRTPNSNRLKGRHGWTSHSRAGPTRVWGWALDSRRSSCSEQQRRPARWYGELCGWLPRCS